MVAYAVGIILSW